MAELDFPAAVEDEAAVALEIVVPFYDEAAALPALFERLRRVFDEAACTAHGLSSVRIILVDDGSKDGSAAIAADAIRGGFPATLYRFSRNFGHQAAVSAGLSYSGAALVAVMDADLQDPPEVVLEMVDAWRAGADVVYAVRRNRKEGVAKRAAYHLFYRLYRFLSEVDVPVDSGDFALLDRKVVDAMESLPEQLRFLRGLRTWVGFRQTAVTYDRAARAFGQSKYDWIRLYQLATDGIASMSVRPLRIVQFALISTAVLTLLMGMGLIATGALAGDLDPIDWWGLAICLAVLGTSSVNLVCLYVLSAYIGRTYLEVKARPGWIVQEVVGAPAPGKVAD